MSFLGGGGGHKSKPEYSGLQLQTSSQDVGFTIAWGQNRFAPNIIWYGDFKSHKHKQKAGKGGGGSNTTYTYSASFCLALCEGPITGIGTVWKDQDTTTDFGSTGFTLFNGSYTQSPWGYLTSAHPTEALAYRGCAYLAIANMDLGSSASPPAFSFEVNSLRYGTGYSNAYDADCALIIQDFLTNQNYGVLFTGDIETDTLLSTGSATTTGDRAYQTYCRAMGWGMSPVLSQQESGDSILDRWTKLTNTALVWTGYSLRFVPQCYTDFSGNGVTYSVDTTPVYSLSDNDFISDKVDPVEVSRTDPADCKNSVRILINNRANQYNQGVAPWKDQGLIDQYGLLQDNDFQANEITDMTMGAVCAALYGKRGAYLRNQYNFTLGIEFSLVEAMDIVEINDPELGTILVEVRKITENDDGSFAVEANDVLPSVSRTAGMDVEPSQGNAANTGADPGPVNTPVIFEPPASLSNGVAQVWAAVSGGNDTTYNPNWGGANVYVSADGGGTYQQIGVVQTAARQGKLTAALASFAGTNPDTTNTLSVGLAMSNGDLQSVTATEAANNSTVCVIKDAGGTTEFLSFQNAALTGTNAYNLTNLYRGQYQSTGLAHSSGAAFARLDDNIFQFDLPQAYVGVPLKFKFQSFNIWGNGTQDLSTCTEYSYTPAGTGYSTGAPVYTPPGTPTSFAGTGGTLSNKLTWAAPSGGAAPTKYNVYGKLGASGTISSAVILGTTTGLTFTHAGLGSNETWRYWVKAATDGGEGAAAGPVDVTTSTGGTSVEVDQNGSSIVAAASKLNFTGTGVTVTDGGGGQANISITGGSSGGGGGNYVKLSQTVLASPAASIDLTSISQSYDDLIVVWEGRSAATSGDIQLLMSINGDTAANYSWIRENRFGTTPGTGAPQMGTSLNSTYTPVTALQMVECTLPSYSSSSRAKLFRGTNADASSNLVANQVSTGYWNNTAAINRLTFTNSDGSNFIAGSKVTIYGRGGSGGSGKPWYWSPPSVSTFPTLVNIGDMTLTNDTDVGLIVDGGTPASGDVTRAALMAIPTPASPWTATCHLEAMVPTNNYSRLGLCIANSALTRNHPWGLDGRNSVWTGNMSFPSGYTSEPTTYSFASVAAPKWLRIKFDGTNFLFQSSPNGKVWVTLDTIAASAWLTQAAYVGVAAGYNRTTGPNVIGSCDYWSFTQP